MLFFLAGFRRAYATNAPDAMPNIASAVDSVALGVVIVREGQAAAIGAPRDASQPCEIAARLPRTSEHALYALTLRF